MTIIHAEPASVHWAPTTQFCKLCFLAGTWTRICLWHRPAQEYYSWFSHGLCVWQWRDSLQYSGPSSLHLPTFSLEAGYLICIHPEPFAYWSIVFHADFAGVYFLYPCVFSFFGFTVLFKVLQIMQVYVHSKLVSSEHIHFHIWP